jgi:hypothetical protein
MEGSEMSHRQTTLLWLKDILEHLTASQERLQWTDDRETTRVLTEAMIRDLERCTRLCENLHRRCAGLVAT